MTIVFDCEVCGAVFELETIEQFDKVLEAINGNIVCKHCLEELSKGNNPWNSAGVYHG